MNSFSALGVGQKPKSTNLHRAFARDTSSSSSSMKSRTSTKSSLVVLRDVKLGVDFSSLELESLEEGKQASADNNINIFEGGLSVWQSRLLLTAIAATYGTNFAVIKLMGESLDGSFSSLLRFSLSSLVFLPFMIKYLPGQKDSNVAALKGGFEIGLWNSIGYFGQSLALDVNHDSASSVAFVCSLAVVVVPILAVLENTLIDKVPVQSKKIINLFIPAILAVIGVGCLTNGGSSSASIFSYFQPVFFGIAYHRQPKLLQSCKETGHFIAFSGASVIAIAATSFAWTLLQSNGIIPGGSFDIANQLSALSNPSVIAGILWTGLISTAGCSLLENIAMKNLSSTDSSVIYSSEPLFGSFFGWLILKETVGKSTVTGACFILLAAFMALKDEIGKEE